MTEEIKPIFPKIRWGKWHVVDRGYQYQVCLTVGGTFPFLGKLYCGYATSRENIQRAIDVAAAEYKASQSLSKQWGVRVDRRGC